VIKYIVMPRKRAVGNIIIPAKLYPERHEFETANVLVSTGSNVIFIAPTLTKGARTPDIEYEGLTWEMKCPIGKSRWTIENQFKRAARQSKNIILDIRHTKIPTEKAISTALKLFKLKRLNRMMIVVDNNKILDFSK